MPYHVYISLQGDNRISIFTMDSETGALRFQERVPVAGGPAPLAVDAQRKFLYAGVRTTPGLVSFRIDPCSGGLTPIGRVPLEADACFIGPDSSGRYLLSAYYQAGLAAVHPIGDDGAVGVPPIEWRPTAANAHAIQTDRSNRYAFVPHIAGPNLIFQFEFDELTGALTPNAVPTVDPPEGAGPRHFCFHPDKDILYFVNEQGGSVTAYHFDPSRGTLAPFQTVSTLPTGFEDTNYCAQIRITPSGRFLYASNRGHDSIACFAIDPSTGLLTASGQQPTEEMPRAFNLDPEGRFLLAAGLKSGRLATYRIDQRTGILDPIRTYTVGTEPMWVLVERLGG